MAYSGATVIINFGSGGVQTDLPQTRISPSKLIDAENIVLDEGYIQNQPGSKNWNSPLISNTQISGGVASFIEYFPAENNQRVFAMSSTGILYKFSDRYSVTICTPEASSSAPTTFNIVGNPLLCSGGQESGGRSKKMFIFSGGDQIQVLSDDGITYRPMLKPAPEWSTNPPKFGLIYRSRLWVFGSSYAPDLLYASSDFESGANEGQEDFQITNTPAKVTDKYVFDVGPGEGEGISAAFVFKNRLYIVKNKAGLYQLNDDGIDPAQWYITKVNSDFGLASAKGIITLFDDVFMLNSQGSLTSLSATFKFGDVTTADVFNNLGCSKYFRDDILATKLSLSDGMYYNHKKRSYLTYTSKGSSIPNRMIIGDIPEQTIELTSSVDDQPSCLGLIKDVYGIARPHYGSNDGYIYSLDEPINWRSKEIYINNCTIFTGSTSLTTSVVVPQDFTGKTISVGGTMATVTSSPVGGNTINFTPAYTGRTIPYIGPTYTTSTIPFTIYERSLRPSDFQTPHMDLSFADPSLSLKNKRFEFLEIAFNPTGSINLLVDVYIDTEFKETISFKLSHNRPLDSFILDTDQVEGDYVKSIRKPLHGQGRAISLRFRNSEYIGHQIQTAMIYFKSSDERQNKDYRS